MFAWDHPKTVRTSVPIQRKLSRVGNINKLGETAPGISALATRHHPDFLAVIEPGIQDLVAVLALEHDLITYTSCEGHPPAPGVVPTERHAGVLARNSSELASVTDLFVSAADTVNPHCDRDSVRVGIMVHEAADEEGRIPAVDVFIHRVSHSVDWATYFSVVTPIYERLVRAVREHRPIHEPEWTRSS